MKKDGESKFGKFWKKFWFIVWKDNSFKGWIISLIFLFVVIKLIFFPLLSLATGTQLPLVIVESCSMYHDGNLFSDFDEWWNRHEIKYFELKLVKDDWVDFRFKKGFNKGDILFVTGVKPESVQVGDVIIFSANYKNPVIHRVVNIEVGEEHVFSTIGDNNNGQLEFEKRITKDQLIGKARANIAPYLGWVKLIFFENSRVSSERGFCEEN